MSVLKESKIVANLRHDFAQIDGLSDYICDYLDSTMDQVVVDVFEEFMAKQPTLAEFVKNAKSGMDALMLLRDTNTEAGGQ